MMTPLRSSSNRTLIVIALVGVFVGGFAVLAALGTGSAQTDLVEPDPSPVIDLSESGRMTFPVLTELFEVDETGRPIPGSGYSVTWTCEADALAVITDGRVTDVELEGTTDSVVVGERVEGLSPYDERFKVYRDKNGDLHQGCDPDSWVLIETDRAEPGEQ